MHESLENSLDLETSLDPRGTYQPGRCQESLKILERGKAAGSGDITLRSGEALKIGLGQDLRFSFEQDLK